MGRCETEKLLNLILKGFFASPLIVAGIIGNLAAFIVFSSRKQKNTVLIFLRSLAIADSLYLLGYFVSYSWYQFYYFYGKDLNILENRKGYLSLRGSLGFNLPDSEISPFHTDVITNCWKRTDGACLNYIMTNEGYHLNPGQWVCDGSTQQTMKQLYYGAC